MVAPVLSIAQLAVWVAAIASLQTLIMQTLAVLIAVVGPKLSTLKYLMECLPKTSYSQSLVVDYHKALMLDLNLMLMGPKLSTFKFQMEYLPKTSLPQCLVLELKVLVVLNLKALTFKALALHMEINLQMEMKATHMETPLSRHDRLVLSNGRLCHACTEIRAMCYQH
jgi:hypothetical protein